MGSIAFLLFPFLSFFPLVFVASLILFLNTPIYPYSRHISVPHPVLLKDVSTAGTKWWRGLFWKNRRKQKKRSRIWIRGRGEFSNGLPPNNRENTGDESEIWDPEARASWAVCCTNWTNRRDKKRRPLRPKKKSTLFLYFIIPSSKVYLRVSRVPFLQSLVVKAETDWVGII